jgi:hypothetical protein
MVCTGPAGSRVGAVVGRTRARGSRRAERDPCQRQWAEQTREGGHERVPPVGGVAGEAPHTCARVAVPGSRPGQETAIHTQNATGALRTPRGAAVPRAHGRGCTPGKERSAGERWPQPTGDMRCARGRRRAACVGRTLGAHTGEPPPPKLKTVAQLVPRPRHHTRRPRHPAQGTHAHKYRQGAGVRVGRAWCGRRATHPRGRPAPANPPCLGTPSQQASVDVSNPPAEQEARHALPCTARRPHSTHTCACFNVGTVVGKAPAAQTPTGPRPRPPPTLVPTHPSVSLLQSGHHPPHTYVDAVGVVFNVAAQRQAELMLVVHPVAEVEGVRLPAGGVRVDLLLGRRLRGHFLGAQRG